VSCNNSIVKVDNMPSDLISYQDLPIAVKEYLNHSKRSYYFLEGSFVLINSADSSLYEFELIQSSVAPWIYQEGFTKLTQGITYELETSYPVPYILYGDTLYIPSQFNILAQIENLEKRSFIKYNFSN
jgi:hypothetical protein